MIEKWKNVCWSSRGDEFVYMSTELRLFSGALWMVKKMRSAEIGIANEETLEKDEGPILKKSLYAWKKITVSLN